MKKEQILEGWMKLVNEFGYLCVGADGPRKIGQIIPVVTTKVGDIEHPWVVIGESTKQDFENQVKFLGKAPNNVYNYYYKVTTD